MFKTTASAAVLAFALGGSALAQTGVGTTADTGAEATTCSSVLADLNERVGALGDTVGGIAGTASDALGDITGSIGLGASGSAETPAGSADASDDASAGTGAGDLDLAAVDDLRQRAQAALDQGDEQQCLDLAAEADAALSAGTR